MKKLIIISIFIVILFTMNTISYAAEFLDGQEVTEIRYVGQYGAIIRDNPVDGEIIEELEPNEKIYVINSKNYPIFQGHYLNYLTVKINEKIGYCWIGYTEHTEVPTEENYIGKFRITTYCPCEICNSGYTSTAIGTRLKPYVTIAVDPKIIPLGSLVHIEGLGDFIAEDTGGRIKGNIIDLCIDNHNTAQHLSYYDKSVYIIK